MNRAVGILVVCLCILASHRCGAQQTETGTGTDSTAAAQDTAAFVMQKSPWGAVLRSAIVPGWGQLYNHSYWKIPLVVGLSGFLVYGIVSEHQSYVDYRDQYAASITPSNTTGNLTLKRFREFYRDNRDTYAWWFLVTYLIQIADAFVDAHLYDFDVSDEVHAHLGVAPAGRLVFSLSW
jgi:hypothetical protein